MDGAERDHAAGGGSRQGHLLLGRRRQALHGLQLATHVRQHRPRRPARDRRRESADGAGLLRRADDLHHQSARRAGPAPARDHAGEPDQGVLHQWRRRGQRERHQDRALGDGAAEDHRALPLIPRRDGGRDHADRRPAALGGRAGHSRRRARDGPVSLSLPLVRRQARLHDGLPQPHRRHHHLRGAADHRRRDRRVGRRHERPHHPAGRLHAGAARALHEARHHADLRRDHERLRAHRRVVRAWTTGASRPTS